MGSIQYLTGLPEFVSYLLSILFFWCYAIAGLLLTRWVLDRLRVPRTQAVMAGWSTALAALTALLFTFVVANLWLHANVVHERVSGEAAAIRLVARDIAPAQRGLLRDYATSVVTDDWPHLCGGAGSPKTAGLLTRLEDQARPANAAESPDFYNQLATLENLRGDRLQAGGPYIPREFWVTLVTLAMLLLAITFFGHHEHLGFQIGLTLVLASAIATLFWLTIQLNYPFCGAETVGPGAIVDAIRSIGS